jgi:hypothetical protein
MATPFIKRLLLRPRQSTPAPDVGSFSIIAGPSDLSWGPKPNGYTDGSGIHIAAVDVSSASKGTQYSLDFDLAGNLLAQTSICTAYLTTGDVHLAPARIKTPRDGVDLTACSAHQAFAEIRFRRNGGSENVVSTGGLTTYPEFLVPTGSSSGTFWLLYRQTQQKWAVIETTNDGATWADQTPWFSDADQCYVEPCWLTGTTWLFHCSTNPNNDNATTYACTVDFSSGAVKNAAGTTIANFKTSTPKATATVADMDLFYAPGTGRSASNGTFIDNTFLVFSVQNNDNQYQESYEAAYNGSGSKIDPANWTISKTGESGYGVGSTTGTPFAYPPGGGPSQEAGIANYRKYVNTRQRGTNFLTQKDRISGVWKDTLFIRSSAQNLDHDDGKFFSPPGGPNGVIPFSFADQANYDSITNAGVSCLNIIRGVGKPTITSIGGVGVAGGAVSLSINEYKDIILTLLADRPCGFNISGGADQSLFESWGNQLYTRARKFAAPDDANTDNVYVVQVTAAMIDNAGTLQESDPVTVSITINDTTKTGGSQQFLQTASLANAAWSKTGLTATANSGDFTDPDGGTAANKVVMAATTAVHRAEQTLTATPGQKYTMGIAARLTTSTHFITLFQNFGSGNGAVVGTFDLFRGRFVGPGNGSSAFEAAIVPLTTNWWLCLLTYTAPATTSSSTVGFRMRQYSGPSSGSELGTTSVNSYWYKPQLMPGDYKTYVARTT